MPTSPAPSRRALHPVRRPGHHRVLLRRGHSLFREAGAHARRGHLHPAAVLERPGRQTCCPAGDYTVVSVVVVTGGRVRSPSGAAAGGRGARNARHAAGGIHRPRSPFASVSDWFLAATIPRAGRWPCRSCTTAAWPNPVPDLDTHAGTPAVARDGVRPGDPGAVADRGRAWCTGWCAWRGLRRLANAMFDRYVIERSGVL